MAYQARWRDAITQRNAYNIRVSRDPVMNDPTRTPEERAFRAERLKSSMMQQDHDNNVALGYDDHIRQAVLVMREAIAADAEDVMHFYGVK